ncbi:MAG: hypothetical protein MRY21_04075 [Simkaniaceae bacterium]|nr:hypothetical protein [Simkaniaceae bacterium]
MTSKIRPIYTGNLQQDYIVKKNVLTETNWERTKRILNVVAGIFFFPYGIWLIAVHFVNKHTLTPKILLTKQSQQSVENARATDPRISKLREIYITTPQGNTLNGVVVDEHQTTYSSAAARLVGQATKRYFKSTNNYLIFVPPPGHSWESMIDRCHMIRDYSSVNVISCNMPGVGKSSGTVTNERDMMHYVAAQVQYLLEQGVNPDNIGVWGSSISAMVAIKVVAAYHRLGKQIRVIADRAAESLNAIIDENMPTAKGYFAKMAAKTAGWKLSCLHDWLSIPDDHKFIITATLDKTFPRHIRLFDKIAKVRQRVATHCLHMTQDHKDQIGPKDGYQIMRTLPKLFPANPEESRLTEITNTAKSYLGSAQTLLSTAKASLWGLVKNYAPITA